MRVKQVRILNALYLGDVKYSRSGLADKLGHPDTNQLNQLVNGHGSFGDRLAAKLEDALGLPDGWMDTPHPGLWAHITTKDIDMNQVTRDILEGMSSSELANIVEAALNQIKSQS